MSPGFSMSWRDRSGWRPPCCDGDAQLLPEHIQQVGPLAGGADAQAVAEREIRAGEFPRRVGALEPRIDLALSTFQGAKRRALDR
jgi:hypothetical protein